VSERERENNRHVTLWLYGEGMEILRFSMGGVLAFFSGLS